MRARKPSSHPLPHSQYFILQFKPSFLFYFLVRGLDFSLAHAWKQTDKQITLNIFSVKSELHAIFTLKIMFTTTSASSFTSSIFVSSLLIIYDVSNPLEFYFVTVYFVCFNIHWQAFNHVLVWKQIYWGCARCFLPSNLNNPFFFSLLEFSKIWHIFHFLHLHASHLQCNSIKSGYHVVTSWNYLNKESRDYSYFKYKNTLSIFFLFLCYVPWIHCRNTYWGTNVSAM